MRTVSLRLADLCENTKINLGRVGDNLHTQVRIDCLKLFEEYPNATAALTVRPPKGDSYPAVVVREGDFVIWNVTDSDLIYPCAGEAQLVFTDGDVVAHKAPFKTVVERSIQPSGQIPTPVQNWVEQANEVLEEVRDAIPEGGTTGQVLAKASNDDYDLEWVDPGSGGTSDYEELDNLPQIGGVTLKGNKTLHDLGAAAESDIPDVSGFYTKPSGGIPDTDLASGVQTSLGKADTAYQKPSGGIPAEDMASGVIPVLTDLIDDTTGSGVTNKVWSADKSSSLLTDITQTKDLVDSVAEKRETLNLFDGNFDEIGYINNSGEDASSNNFKRTSTYYPIDGTTYSTLYSYNLDNGGTTNIMFYNSSKEYLGKADIAGISQSKSIPSGTAFFRIYRDKAKTKGISITYTYQGKFIPYRRWTGIKSGCVGYNALDEDARAYANPLYGKNILVFGDSIWGNDRTDGVCDFLAAYSGANVYNGAVGGTNITNLRTTDSPAYLPFDGVNIVHALMTDTWTDQEANKASVISYVATDTLPMLEALDVSSLDMIILSYGRNDITTSETLAEIQTALETIIDDIQSHYPTIRILVLTPIWGMFASKTIDGDSYTSTSGMTLRSLADGLMTKAKAKHVSSCDMLENMQLSQNTKATYMDSDEVHLNAKGNAMYAHIVHGKLRSLF